MAARWRGMPELARAAELEAAGVRAPPMATLAAALRARRGAQVPRIFPRIPRGSRRACAQRLGGFPQRASPAAGAAPRRVRRCCAAIA